jgi:hypothetical protein
MSFHKEKHIITIAGGVGTGKSNLRLRGLLWQIIIQPTSSDTVWSMDLRNGKGEEIGGWDGDVGDLNSTYGLVIPVNGKINWRFFDVKDSLDAVRDEPITMRIVISEPVY